MIDRRSVIEVLEETIPFIQSKGYCAFALVMHDAAQLLKAQEPRLVVKDDFVNADKYGYLPVFVENKDGEMYWDCITDAALGDTVSRFWTMKPTDEQRKALKWDAND